MQHRTEKASKESPIDYCSMFAHEMVVSRVRPAARKIDIFRSRQWYAMLFLAGVFGRRVLRLRDPEVVQVDMEDCSVWYHSKSLAAAGIVRGVGLLNRKVQAA